jgi:sugar/nucleoside kinase (ribokinase family)
VGHAIRSDLQAHGINLHAIEILPQAISAQAYIMVRQGDGARHIAYLPMAANEPAWPRVENLLQQHWDLLYLNGRHEGVAQAAAQIAVRHSLPIAFDGGAGRYRPSLRPLVQASRLLIVAQEFAQRYVGKALTPEELGPLLLKDAAQVVVITAGIHGSHVWSQAGDYFHQSAYSAQPLVDTTGCGDVYHGAFTAGWLKQLPLRTVAEHASRLAAKTAEGLGGRWALLPVKSR